MESQLNSPPRFGHLAALFFCVLSFPSCATIISGSSQAVSIDSNVEGADVAIEGNHVGATPFTGKIKRQKEAVVLVSAPGYQSQPLVLTTSFNAVSLLDILGYYLGFFSTTTDCLTGAVWEYSPNSYYVNLKPKGAADSGFRSESSVMAYAMTFFGDLEIEIAAGDGPKLRALHREYFHHYELDALVHELRKASQGDPVEFGEAVSGLLRS